MTIVMTITMNMTTTTTTMKGNDNDWQVEDIHWWRKVSTSNKFYRKTMVNTNVRLEGSSRTFDLLCWVSDDDDDDDGDDDDGGDDDEGTGNQVTWSILIYLDIF